MLDLPSIFWSLVLIAAGGVCLVILSRALDEHQRVTASRDSPTNENVDSPWLPTRLVWNFTLLVVILLGIATLIFWIQRLPS
jgi:hypothetical protein